MPISEREKEWAGKASRFIKAETKRVGIGYRELADRLNAHGMQETEDSIASKLARGTFSVTFFLGCLVVLGLEGVRLDQL